MVLRNFAADRTATGGSTFTNISRPVGSTVLAIWALATSANELALKVNAAKKMLAVSVVRFVIWPQGRLSNGGATYSVFGAAPPFRSTIPKTVTRLTRLAKYEAVPSAGGPVL